MRKHVKLTVRLPADIQKWLAAHAAENDQSMNNAIVRTLRQRMTRERFKQKAAQ